MTFKTLILTAFDRARDELLSFRYRNRPYLEYYREVMRRRAQRNPKDAVGGRWEMGSELQIKLLRKHGLLAHHTLLDIGCGSLRGGLNIIRYLERGNYTGIDISEEILKAGSRFLQEAGLEAKRPRLLCTDNLEFREIEDSTFDYLLAVSVLTHMPPEDIETLFSNLHKVMPEGSIFLATVFLSKTDSIYSTVARRNFFYPYEWLQATGNRYGLTITRDIESDGKQNMLVITRTGVHSVENQACQVGALDVPDIP